MPVGGLPSSLESLIRHSAFPARRQWGLAYTSTELFILPATPLFHLAFPVRDIAEARRFYGDLLGCPEGRSSDAWVDFDFYGHQVVAHLSPDECRNAPTGDVDGD